MKIDLSGGVERSTLSARCGTGVTLAEMNQEHTGHGKGLSGLSSCLKIERFLTFILRQISL
jgi:hypothetical protein